MRWALSLIVMGVVLFGINTAYSQELGLATYQETAQVLIDKTISQNVKSSITLQSTSVQELKVPAELEQRIREDKRISAVILTKNPNTPNTCLLYTSPSPRDRTRSRMPSSA